MSDHSLYKIEVVSFLDHPLYLQTHPVTIVTTLNFIVYNKRMYQSRSSLGRIHHELIHSMVKELNRKLKADRVPEVT